MWRALLVCLITSLWVSGAIAAERVLLYPQDPGARANARSATSESLQALRKTAAEKGSVRVMVGLKVPFAPEGHLRQAETREQREEIAAAASAIRGRFSAAVSRAPDSFQTFDTVPFLSMEVTPDELERLSADPLVISIVEVRAAKLQLAESVPLVQGAAAHAEGFNGSGQVIAILDTGVDKNHPFLGSRVISEACYSSKRKCPRNQRSSTAPGSGMPCKARGCGHGTHVAGIAVGLNSSMAGVASEANIISIQVFSPTSDGLWTYDPDILAGLERVYALRNTFSIAAVNLSLGGFGYPFTCDSDNWAISSAINNLKSAGIATIVSSGNDGFTNQITSPACISTSISVGSVSDAAWGPCLLDGFGDGQPTARDKVACYSNSAHFLSLLAPGSFIDSSVPRNSYDEWHGTSMAAPHVAGAWAVIKQKAPSASVDQILAALRNTGTPVTDYRNGITTPRINVKAALDQFTATPVISYTRAGSGRGTVTFSPAGSAPTCTESCDNTFTPGTRVTLGATPQPGSIFEGWSGACTGTGSCSVMVAAARTVTATFTAIPTKPVTLSFLGTGSGTVAFSPAGDLASCSANCTGNFREKSRVKLTPTAAPGSRFSGWSGACRGTRTCSLTMSAAKAVTADFRTVPIYALNYSRAGAGSGTVSFSPAGSAASCDESCSNSFTDGTRVTLRAVAGTGARFSGWSGACRGTRSCTLTMHEAKSVTATFTPVPVHVLAYTRAGAGSGSVSFSPAGSVANCQESCSSSFSDSTVVTLRATPAAGSRFAGWTGACRGTRSCKITMNEAKSVTATFSAARTAGGSSGPR
jgi:subtilisin family serine protease